MRHHSRFHSFASCQPSPCLWLPYPTSYASAQSVSVGHVTLSMTCSCIHTACLTSDYSRKNCGLDRAYLSAAARVVRRSSRECSASQPSQSRFWLLFPATFLCSCIRLSAVVQFALPSQYTYYGPTSSASLHTIPPTLLCLLLC